MKMNVNELTGAALDWAVAQLEANVGWSEAGEDRDFYSTRWDHGGPIVQERGIMIRVSPTQPGMLNAYFRQTGTEGPNADGATHLLAAMRCLVGAGARDSMIDIPDELVGVV